MQGPRHHYNVIMPAASPYVSGLEGRETTPIEQWAHQVSIHPIEQFSPIF